ncbi:MAG: hypothetical protein MUF30_08475, partial [Burkholderiales bacterium]|nr:hypothetical protein [Burkholderiales bacterium]
MQQSAQRARAQAEAGFDAAVVACVQRLAATAHAAASATPGAFEAVIAAAEARDTAIAHTFFGADAHAGSAPAPTHWFEWLQARHETAARFATDIAERIPVDRATQRRVLQALRLALTLTAPEHTLPGRPDAWREALATDGA